MHYCSSVLSDISVDGGSKPKQSPPLSQRVELGLVFGSLQLTTSSFANELYMNLVITEQKKVEAKTL